MTNLEKFSKSFMDAFDLVEAPVGDLKYQEIPAWDSVGHMALIAALEETFDLMLDTDDIVDFSSYEKGLKILSEKYNVKF